MWAKYIWVFADFQSAIRNEGGKPGINDKGLVTYDRKIKKDAFYFYKANWSTEPMIYITSRRFTKRPEASVQVKVYSNLHEYKSALPPDEIAHLALHHFPSSKSDAPH